MDYPVDFTDKILSYTEFIIDEAKSVCKIVKKKFMKTIITIFILLFFLTFSVQGQTTKKEIVIVGTMHWVPKSIKNAYKPMYKKAYNYNPQNIYVEYVPKTDLASIEFYYSDFSHEVDSLRNIMSVNMDSVRIIQAKDLHNMSTADFQYLKKYHLLEKDLLHYKYYKHLVKHGINGPEKATRNENGDVSFKLAAKLGMRELSPMDYQISNKEYYKYWHACDSIYEAQGRTEDIQKLMKKITRKGVIGTILKGNARHTNTQKTYESYHKVNSLHYFENPEDVCIEGSKAWEVRNDKMIEYIGEGVRSGNQQRNLVVVGAGHLYSLKKGLEERYPDITITTLYK